MKSFAIHDRIEYKKFNASLGNSPASLTFPMNTDGVALFQSSSKCKLLWPIWLSINELPPAESTEANFTSRYKPFKNVCHIETSVNFELHSTITLDRTGLCSYFKVQFVELIEKKKKRIISQFSYLPH